MMVQQFPPLGVPVTVHFRSGVKVRAYLAETGQGTRWYVQSPGSGSFSQFYPEIVAWSDEK